MTKAMKLWGRQWVDDFGSKTVKYQGLYAIPLVPDGLPNVGVRITISMDTLYYLRQSSAVAELFDGQRWHVVASLPPALMKAGATMVRGSDQRAWTDEGAERDIDLLLADCALAFAFRAPGSNEWPKIQRDIGATDAGTQGDNA